MVALTQTMLSGRLLHLATHVTQQALAHLDDTCPACGEPRAQCHRDDERKAIAYGPALAIYRACSCNAIYGFASYQESLKVVKNQMEPPTGPGFQGDVIYFDFMVYSLGPQNEIVTDRRHGWFNIHSGLIVQTG